MRHTHVTPDEMTQGPAVPLKLQQPQERVGSAASLHLAWQPPDIQGTCAVTHTWMITRTAGGFPPFIQGTACTMPLLSPCFWELLLVYEGCPQSTQPCNRKSRGAGGWVFSGQPSCAQLIERPAWQNAAADVTADSRPIAQTFVSCTFWTLVTLVLWKSQSQRSMPWTRVLVCPGHTLTQLGHLCATT